MTQETDPGAHVRVTDLGHLYRIRYNWLVSYVIQQTVTFAKWRASLKDLRAATAIRRRIERAQAGNLGDFKPVQGDVSEMRIDVGPGYRLYFTIRDGVVVFLLTGGSKSTQSADIRRAVKMAREI